MKLIYFPVLIALGASHDFLWITEYQGLLKKPKVESQFKKIGLRK